MFILGAKFFNVFRVFEDIFPVLRILQDIRGGERRTGVTKIYLFNPKDIFKLLQFLFLLYSLRCILAG